MGMAIRSETEVLPRLPLNLALVHADLYTALKTLKGYPCIINFQVLRYMYNFFYKTYNSQNFRQKNCLINFKKIAQYL